MKVRVLLLVALACLSVPASALASVTAPVEERAGISAATGISDACLVADIAVADASWAMAAISKTAVGCVNDGTWRVAHKDPATMTWTQVTSVTEAGACPLAGVPTIAALDFSLCELATDVEAEALAQTLLGARFGNAWTTKPNRWVQCPDTYFGQDEEGVGTVAYCEFEMPRTANILGGRFSITNTEAGVQLYQMRSRAYKRRPATCRLAKQSGTLDKRLVIKGRAISVSPALGCPLTTGPGSFVAKVDALVVKRYPTALPTVMTVWMNGAAVAGFDDRYKMSCRVNKRATYAVNCTNSRKDTLRYTFTVIQKPKPKPEPSGDGGGSGCHPSYTGACLQQGIGDYDCKGGSGNGPNYTGPVTVVGPDEFDLDRDGDGFACE